MNKYNQIKHLKDTDFKRLTGVSKLVYQRMVSILRNILMPTSSNRTQGGRPRKISYEDQVLLCLEYLREYRTYYHICISYGMSESSAHRLITQTEDVLIKSQEFILPKRKELEDNLDIEVILIDASEHPIQRPKKSKEDTIVVKRKDTH